MRLLKGDVRDPQAVLSDPHLNELIDWAQPVAVLLAAVLHFVAEDPAAIVAAFRERLCPGSLMVISHVCSTGADPDEVTAVEKIYSEATAPGVFRTREEISGLFEGLELIEPGVVPAQQWRPPVTLPLHNAFGPVTLRDVPVLGGIGRVPPRRAA